MRRVTILLTAVTVCSGLVVAGLVNAQKVPNAVSRHFEVRMVGGNAFDPPTIDVSVGDTVTWINDDENSVHTATSEDNGTTFDTSNVTQFGHSARIKRFDAAGTISYHCKKHPGTMRAKVIVAATNP